MKNYKKALREGNYISICRKLFSGKDGLKIDITQFEMGATPFTIYHKLIMCALEAAWNEHEYVMLVPFTTDFSITIGVKQKVFERYVFEMHNSGYIKLIDAGIDGYFFVEKGDKYNDLVEMVVRAYG